MKMKYNGKQLVDDEDEDGDEDEDEQETEIDSSVRNLELLRSIRCTLYSTVLNTMCVCCTINSFWFAGPFHSSSNFAMWLLPLLCYLPSCCCCRAKADRRLSAVWVCVCVCVCRVFCFNFRFILNNNTCHAVRVFSQFLAHICPNTHSAHSPHKAQTIIYYQVEQGIDL